MKRASLAGLAIVIGAGIALWLAMPGVQRITPRASQHLPTAPTTSADDPDQTPSPTRAAGAPDTAPGRDLVVHVTGCHRAAAPGAEVRADVGTDRVVGRADRLGDVHLRIAPGAAAKVAVRVQGFEGTGAVTADQGELDLTVCPGATVSGRVIDGLGNLVAGVRVTLVDAQGMRIDDATSDKNGRYEVQDVDVIAAGLRLDLAPNAPASRAKLYPLVPALAPAEARTIDLVAVGGREIRGFVLDLEGTPLAGISVLVGTPTLKVQWRLLTDSGGAFALPSAPTGTIVIAADGQDQGQATATIPASDRATTVDLVLTPSATLTVVAPDVDGAQVEVTFANPDVFAPPVFGADPDPNHLTIQPAPPDPLNPPDPADPADPLNPADPALPTPTPDPTLVSPALPVVAAEGVVGKPLSLPAGVWYRVAILVPAGDAVAVRPCGELHLAAGADTIVTCTRGRATLTADLIDAGGKPLAGLPVVLEAGGTSVQGMTNPKGHLELSIDVEGALSGSLGVLRNGPTADPIRRNVLLVVGRRELGRVVVHEPVDLTGPGARPLGAALGEDRYGLSVQEVARDSTLELAGVDPGDRIIAIDGADAIELPLGDALARLARARAGLLLRVRTALGEQYDLELTP